MTQIGSCGNFIHAVALERHLVAQEFPLFKILPQKTNFQKFTNEEAPKVGSQPIRNRGK